MKNKPYQWIFFDADRTLLDFDRSAKFALKAAMMDRGLGYDPNYQAIYEKFNRACWRAYEAGEISSTELASRRFELFFQSLNKETDPVTFNQLYLDKLADTDFLIDDCKATLAQLQPKYHLLIITNGLKAVQRRRLAKSGLDNYFKDIIVSEEIGVAKPHVGFFEKAFDQIGHPKKEQVLVVGDSLNSDIQGGINYGLDTCWFNPEGHEHPADIQPDFQSTSLKDLSQQLLS